MPAAKQMHEYPRVTTPSSEDILLIQRTVSPGVYSTASITAEDLVLQGATGATGAAGNTATDNTMGNLLDATRIYTGVVQSVTGDAQSTTTANAWHLPPQKHAVAYDRVYLQLTADAVVKFKIRERFGSSYKILSEHTVSVVAADAYTSVDYTVPANGTLTVERVSGGSFRVQGYRANTDENGFFTVGEAVGTVSSRTSHISSIGFGASGYEITLATGEVEDITTDDLYTNTDSIKGPSEFIIGTWLPRIEEIDKWVYRGINTAVHVELDFVAPNNGTALKKKILDSGMKLIYRPGRLHDSLWTAGNTLAEMKVDATDDRILAWSMPDETDLFNHPLSIDYGGAFTLANTAEAIRTEIAGWRQAHRSKPVFAGYSGYNVMLGQRPELIDVSEVNWFGTDIYPNVGNSQYLFNDSHYLYTTTAVGWPIRQTIQQGVNYNGAARPLSAIGKPHLAAIGTGRVVYGNTAETPARFRANVWTSFINGASGIFLFPQCVGDNSNPSYYVQDDSTQENLDQLWYFSQCINALDALGAVIDTDKGGRRAYKIRPCAQADFNAGNENTAVFNTARNEQLPGPFEGIEVTLDSGDRVRIILNLRNSTNTLTDTIWGYTNLSFAAYEVKAFLESAPTTNIFQSIYASTPPAAYTPPASYTVPAKTAELDFAGSTYSLGGVSKTITQVVTQDSNWGTWDRYGALRSGAGIISQFDTAGLLAANPVLTTEAATAVGIRNFTAVMDIRLGSSGGGDGLTQSIGITIFDSPSYGSAWYLNLGNPAPFPANFGDYGSTSATLPTLSIGKHRVAFTFTESELAICIDGGTTYYLTGHQANTAANLFGFSAYCARTSDSNGGASTALEAIRFYAPQPRADLQNLSLYG